MALKHHTSSFLLEADALLYCEEEEHKWEDEGDDDDYEDEEINQVSRSTKSNTSLIPILLLEQDLFWEDEELISLSSKEKQQHCSLETSDSSSSSHSVLGRCEAVQWMLKVNAHYGFSPLTSILAINYLDRFLSSSLHSQKENNKPWMIQLVAVTCLSLAAKVEETHVPLLLDLQVEESKYVFEAKTIQRMELMVLSTLQWKMNPVTPISFLDHIIRRLGLKTHLHWEFLKRCELLLLSIVSDWRFVRYLPSVLATATMLHVINQIEPCNPIDYQNQLLSVLKISKEEVKECYEMIFEITNTCEYGHENGDHSKKRKRMYVEEMMMMRASSPSCVVDAHFSSSTCDGSNDSWTSYPDPQHVFKKSRGAQEQQMRLSSSSLNNNRRLFVDAVGNPP